SGDLAPLAHLALVLIGEGEAFVRGERLSGRAALERAGLQPVVLEAKEGLALVNGTQAMQAVGVLALLEAERCGRIADIADALTFVRRTLEIEANAATDNPLVFAAALDDAPEGTIVSGGNFHGQPVSQALDLLAIACTQLQTISERRVEQLVNPSLSGLPPFLARNSGLNSGF